MAGSSEGFDPFVVVNIYLRGTQIIFESLLFDVSQEENYNLPIVTAISWYPFGSLQLDVFTDSD